MIIIWEKLETYLSVHEPELLADLNPPTTDLQIRDLEKALSLQLPADFLACLRIHNGQKGKADWLFEGHEFLSIEKILMDWATLNRLLDDGDFDGEVAKPDSEVISAWWSPSWVPFTSNGGGDHFCLDLAPSSKGTPGQVIKYSGELPSRRLKALSFSRWFESFVNAKVGC